MILYTISTPDWLDKHVVRWVRKARESNAGVRLQLILSEACEHEVLREFEKVWCGPWGGKIDRPWFNSIRIEIWKSMVLTRCGSEPIIYCDADADVMLPLEPMPELIEGGVTLRCVKSYGMHGDWLRVRDEMGWVGAEEMNNGFLVMGDDWSDRYKAAVEIVEGLEEKCNPRIAGTIAFNVMLRRNEGQWDKLPNEWSVVWHDWQGLLEAKVVQFCNDMGQSKREELEREWKASR